MMNREALEYLADKLLPRVKLMEFDMHDWTSRGHCGTAACAIGHAAKSPWFKRRGFMLEKVMNPTPAYKGNAGWDAVTDFFGINFDQAQHLFDWRSYPENPTPCGVAQRIKRFLADDGAFYRTRYDR